jgi:dTDP-4-amino-4,6-dideoxygalactose transaminase
MTSTIPQADPAAAYLAQKDAIDAAVARALSSGWYILGGEVTAFEKEFAAFQDAAHGVAVASGTAALQLGLRALGVQPGDVVATVSHTAVATVAAIELVGAVPVLVDIDDFYTLDVEGFAATVASGVRGKPVRAVIPVHLYGQVADMPAIVGIAHENGIGVVEDCAQAHGARLDGTLVGKFGDLGAYSLYPTKNLGAIGDGGIITTDKPHIAEELKRLREYGWGTQRYVSYIAGDNSRLDELQAAILRVKLTRLADDNARRRSIAAAYDRALAGSGLETPKRRDGVEHVFHQYVVATDKRDRLRDLLKEEGVATNIHYPVPVHLQPAYADRVAMAPPGCWRTERAAGRILSLPIFPQMTDAMVEHACEALKKTAARL